MKTMRLLRHITTLLCVSFSALACSSALASSRSRATWTGVVSSVVDGDTVRVRPPDGGKPISVRIDGIDAPEICQSGGIAARDALKRRILDKRVVLRSKVRDIYGRLVAKVLWNGQDQGKWLVTQGHAWSYRYRQDAGPYAAQERRAHAAGLGLFSPAYKKTPVYPREFRKQHGSCYV